MKECLQCGQKYSDEKKYCLRCGIALDKDNRQESLKCNQCGTQNNSDYKFCKKCGKQLNSKKEIVPLQEEQIHTGPLRTEEKLSSVSEPSTAQGESSDLTDEIKEQVKKIANEAFKKAGIVKKESLYDEKKFNSAVEIAYKLLPFSVRILVKKDSMRDLLRDIFIQNAPTLGDTETFQKGDRSNHIVSASLPQMKADGIAGSDIGHDIKGILKKPSGGEELYEEYLLLAASDTGTAQEKIDILNRALASGLPVKEEIFARLSIGTLKDGHEEAFEYYDHALELAAKNKEIFSSSSIMLLCRRVCIDYVKKTRDIKEKKGLDAALSYLLLREKLLRELCSPLLFIELALLHKEKNPDDYDIIAYYYKKVIDSQILDDFDKSCVQNAKVALSKLERLISTADLKVEDKIKVSATTESTIRPNSSGAAAEFRKVNPVKSYTKFIIVGVVVILIAAGFFLKSYLSKPSGQAGKEVVAKPQTVVVPAKPIEQPKPSDQQQHVFDQSKEQPPAAEVDRSEKPDSLKMQTAPSQRLVIEQKPTKKESVAKPRQQVTPPEITKDQEPKKQEKKSFTPPSRDNL